MTASHPFEAEEKMTGQKGDRPNGQAVFQNGTPRALARLRSEYIVAR